MSKVLLGSLVCATASLAQIPDLDGTLEARAAAPAEVVLWNRTVVVLRAAIVGISPEERAEGIRSRVEQLPLEETEIRAEPASIRGLEGIAIFAGTDMLFGLVPEDLDPESNESLEAVARTAVRSLQEILGARAEAHRPGVILKGLAYSAGSLVLLLLFVRGVRRVRRLSERLHPPDYLKDVHIYGFDVTPAFSYLGRSTVRILSAGVVLFALYLFVAFALSQFPSTRPWGEGLGRFLLVHFFELGKGVLGAVPGLLTAALIFVAGRVLSRAVRVSSNEWRRARRLFPGWTKIPRGRRGESSWCSSGSSFSPPPIPTFRARDRTRSGPSAFSLGWWRLSEPPGS